MAHLHDERFQIVLKDLPASAELYPRWRYNLRSAVLAAIGDQVALSYLAEIDATTLVPFEDLANTLDPSLFKLDRRLFSAILTAIKAPELAKYHEQIESRCQFGCGRQALRVLDAAHLFNNAQLQSNAASTLYALTCPSMDNLSQYLASYRLCVQRLGGTNFNEFVGFQLLQKSLEQLQDTRAVFALHRSLQLTGSASLEMLLQNLETLGVEHDSKKGSKSAAAAMAVPTCTFCKKRGHDEKSCFKNPKSSKYKGDSDAKGKDKGSSGKAGKGKGKGDKHQNYPRCPHCGRTNHEADRCFFKPSHSASSSTSPMAPPGLAQMSVATGGSQSSSQLLPAQTADPLIFQTAFQNLLQKKMGV